MILILTITIQDPKILSFFIGNRIEITFNILYFYRIQNIIKIKNRTRYGSCDLFLVFFSHNMCCLGHNIYIYDFNYT